MRQLWFRARRAARSRIGQVTLAFNLLLVFVPAAGVLYLDVYEARLLEAQERSMVQQARLVAAAVAELPDRDAIERVFARLEQRSDSRLRVYDASGALVADSARVVETPADELAHYGRPEDVRRHLLYRVGAALAQVGDWIRSVRLWRTGETVAQPEQPGEVPPEVRAALAGRYGAATRSTPGQRSLTLYSAMPVRHDGRVVGAVVVSQSTFRILQALYAIRLRLFEVIVASVVVATLLSVLAAARIVRPLVRLRTAAVLIAERRGKLPVAFAGSSRRDEIGDLARALEYLTRRLDEHIRLLESFAADVAHEFKNPLASIRTAGEMVASSSDPVERERFVALMSKDVDRLERLVSGVRELARIDGQLESEPLETVDLHQLVEEVVDGLRFSTPAATAIAISRLGDRPAFVRGSKERLVQVIENLLTNALSFSESGRPVRITIHADDAACRVRVEDEGPGIPDGHLERVFDRFFSYRPGGRRRDHIGLGLAIARAIVTGYGGTIRAANREQGGAVFEIELQRTDGIVAARV